MMQPAVKSPTLDLICPPLPPKSEWHKLLQKNWIVDGWFEADDIVMWSGEPGIGKSVVTLAMALGLASGQPMLGFWPHPTGQPFRVAILDLENKTNMIFSRLIRLSQTLNIDLESIYNKSLKIFSLRGFGLFDKGPIEKHVRNSLLDFSPEQIVLDTIMSATTQETLSPLEGARFIQRDVMSWSREMHAGWQLIHHNKKPDTKVSKEKLIGDQNQSSGGGFVGMSDALVLLQKDSNGQIVMTNPKQRHTDNSGQFYVRIDDFGLEDGPLAVRMSETPMAVLPDEMLMFEALKAMLPVKSSDATKLLAKQFRVSDRHASRWISSWVNRKLIDVTDLPHENRSTTGGRPPRMLSLFKPSQIQL
jgi:hypothetical protein